MSDARPVAKGVTISIGDPDASLFTINCQVAMIGALEPKPTFNTLCRQGHETPGRIRQHNACEVCDNSDRDTFESGRQVGDGWIIVGNDDKAILTEAAKKHKTNIVLRGHPLDDVINQTLPGDKAYQLVSEDPGRYSLVRDFLASHPEVTWVGNWTPKSAVGLFRLAVFHDALYLLEIARPADVREAVLVEGQYNLKLLEHAHKLLPDLVGPFVPDLYLAPGVAELDEALAGREVIGGQAIDTTTQTDEDLLAAMEAAVKAKKPARRRRTAA